MSALRGLGHIKDRHDPTDQQVHQLIGFPAFSPDVFDLSKHVDHVRDQGESSSCTGQAVSRACHIRAQVMGIAGVSYPSALEAYAVGRALDRGNPDEPLQDVGARPRMVTLGCQQWGLVAEQIWPFDMARINDDLPLDVLQQAAGHRLTGYYRIDQIGSARSEMLRHALASGYPVCAAFEVDAGFDNNNGIDAMGQPFGASRGGHYVCIVGYGPGYFDFVNSWGPTWGREGFGRVSDARIEHFSTTDIQVVTVAELA